MGSPPWRASKSHLDQVLGTLLEVAVLEQGLDLMVPEVPSHPNQSGVVYTFPDTHLFFISFNVVGKMETTRVSSDGLTMVFVGVLHGSSCNCRISVQKKARIGNTHL